MKKHRRFSRRFSIFCGKLAVTTLFTLAMYSILALVAFRERGYEAIGGELLAALLFGALVYYSLSYIEFTIMEELKKRHHRKPVDGRMEI